jgi:hypothetical protein
MHNQSEGDTIRKGATELEMQIPNLVKKWGHILQDDYNIQMNAVRYWIRATAMEIACLGYSYKDYYICVLVILLNSVLQFTTFLNNLE